MNQILDATDVIHQIMSYLDIESKQSFALTNQRIQSALDKANRQHSEFLESVFRLAEQLEPLFCQDNFDCQFAQRKVDKVTLELQDRHAMLSTSSADFVSFCWQTALNIETYDHYTFPVIAAALFNTSFCDPTTKKEIIGHFRSLAVYSSSERAHRQLVIFYSSASLVSISQVYSIYLAEKETVQAEELDVQAKNYKRFGHGPAAPWRHPQDTAPTWRPHPLTNLLSIGSSLTDICNQTSLSESLSKLYDMMPQTSQHEKKEYRKLIVEGVRQIAYGDTLQFPGLFAVWLLTSKESDCVVQATSRTLAVSRERKMSHEVLSIFDQPWCTSLLLTVLLHDETKALRLVISNSQVQPDALIDMVALSILLGAWRCLSLLYDLCSRNVNDISNAMQDDAISCHVATIILSLVDARLQKRMLDTPGLSFDNDMALASLLKLFDNKQQVSVLLPHMHSTVSRCMKQAMDGIGLDTFFWLAQTDTAEVQMHRLAKI